MMKYEETITARVIDAINKLGNEFTIQDLRYLKIARQNIKGVLLKLLREKHIMLNSAVVSGVSNVYKKDQWCVKRAQEEGRERWETGNATTALYDLMVQANFTGTAKDLAELTGKSLQAASWHLRKLNGDGFLYISDYREHETNPSTPYAVFSVGKQKNISKKDWMKKDRPNKAKSAKRGVSYNPSKIDGYPWQVSKAMKKGASFVLFEGRKYSNSNQWAHHAKSPGGMAREALKSVQFERSLKAVPFAEVKLSEAEKAALNAKRDRDELAEVNKAMKELFGW